MPDPKNEQPDVPQKASSRSSVIRAVQTPLGFFSLVVLLVEVVLASGLPFSQGGERTALIAGMLALVFLLVLLVAGIAVFRPHALYGIPPPRPEPVFPTDGKTVRTPKPVTIKRPRILVANAFGHQFLEEIVAREARNLRTLLEGIANVHYLEAATSAQLRAALTESQFEVVQLSTNVIHHGDEDVRLSTADGFLSAEGLLDLLQLSKTKLLIIASCNSVPLAAKASSRMNMIAATTNLPVDTFEAWQKVFYSLLSRGVALSDAHRTATSSANAPMALFLTEDFTFGRRRTEES